MLEQKKDSEEKLDGVCFYCGNYAEMVYMHEKNVHGNNRLLQQELY
ncbi:hypothetical protein HYX10_00160 [Candidatus Woesearchaeota archaeon]|nr:hypothetical protein [Candidatus Woesearchaeota archaeon]